MRDRLARHVLLTDLVAVWATRCPRRWPRSRSPTSPGARGRLRAAGPALAAAPGRAGQLCRRRQQGRAGVLARRSSTSIPRTIAEVETFLAVERALLRHVEENCFKAGHARPARAGRRPAVPLLVRGHAHRSRLAGHWSPPPPRCCWKPTGSPRRLKKPPTTVPALVKAYAEGEAPWCLLDTHHRHMESRWYNFESEPATITGPRQAHHQGRAAIHRGRLRTGQALRHAVRQGEAPDPGPAAAGRRVFETQVKPKLGERQDRLRLGRCPAVRDGAGAGRSPQGRLRPDPPTRHRHDAHDHRDRHGLARCPRPTSRRRWCRWAAASSAWRSPGRSSRTARTGSPSSRPTPGCRSSTPSSTTCCPSRRRRCEDGIQGAQLVLVTSQEIDELCEADNITQARLPDGRRAERPAAGRSGSWATSGSRRSSSPPTTGTCSARRSART